MDIELIAGTYKSIESLEWNDIPEFAVVTGRNGSGKTQLLELINHFLGLNAEQKRGVEKSQNNPFNGVKLDVRDFQVQPDDVVFLQSNWTLGNIGRINTSVFSSAITKTYNHIVGNKRDNVYAELAGFVLERAGKDPSKMTIEDVQQHLPLDYFDYLNTIQLHEGLNEASVHYYLKMADMKLENAAADVIRQELGEPPWETLNRLLEKAEYPYLVTSPTSLVGDFNTRLVSRDGPDTIVDFGDLSAGEKMLISLAIWMFNSGREKRLPKLLLLDEPDAHLHPSGIRQFINVIERNLVNNFGVRVIMSTHSPTTVSFAPEYSLFEMSRTAPQISLLKSKDYGVGLLTDGLITVKRNTRYVLVEDKDDVDFYSTVFRILHSLGQIEVDVGVMFVPASNKNAGTSGGKTVVEDWVKKFTDEGVLDVFSGLIDKDTGNSPTTNIRVIGRYSIENYLLDPVIVFASVVHEDPEFEVPGVDINQKNIHKLSGLDDADLKKIADHILGLVKPLLTGLTPDLEEVETISYTNGRSIQCPKWLLEQKGHDLFQKFRGKFGSGIAQDKLRNTIRRHDLVSVDLADLLRDIQQAP